MADSPSTRTSSASPRNALPALNLWAALLGLAALAFAAVAWSERLPRPQPLTAADTLFAAARALPVLTMLADSIGMRVTGTPGAQRAAAFLASRMRAIDGLDVDVQDVIGVRPTWYGAIAYRTRNVLARRRGESASSVILSSHYDGQEEGVAAADAALASAVIVEVARAIASSPRPRHTIVFSINGAEERGLVGAHGTLAHPWLNSARAFVDLESAGNRGKAILFQVGPGNAWLADAYGRAAPHPYGTVIGQDVFATGAVPSTTDFEVYAAAGIPGLDLALFRNGYAYHTPLDVAAAIAPGSLQHMGANALAVTRELASGELIQRHNASRSVYYDLLGVTMISYTAATARLVAAIALILALAAVAWTTWRLRTRAADVAIATMFALAAAVIGAIVPVAAAAFVSIVLGRPHRWFAHPAPAITAYAALATAVVLAAQWAFARIRQDRRDSLTTMTAALSGGLLVLSMLLMLLTLANVASAYLLVWWILPGTLALLALASSNERAWPLALLLGVVPGLLLTMQFATLLLSLFLPIAGRMVLAVPFDLVVAALVSGPVLLMWMLPAAILHRGARPGSAAVVAVLVSATSLAISATMFPYSAERPQRIAIRHEDADDGARLFVRAGDYPGPARALAAVPEATPAPGSRQVYHVPARERGFPPPDLIISAGGTDSGNTRTASLRIPPGDAYEYVLRIPTSRLAAWSIGERIPVPRGRAEAVLQLVAAPDTGWLVTLHVAGVDSVVATLSTTRLATTTDAQRLLDALPEWTAPHAVAVSRREFRF